MLEHRSETENDVNGLDHWYGGLSHTPKASIVVGAFVVVVGILVTALVIF